MLIAVAGIFAVSGQFRSGISSQADAQNGDLSAAKLARGKLIAASRCAVCHGRDGNAPDPQYPKLAGQNPAYLYQQLLAFKSGERSSAVMAAIARDLSDAEADDAADFYARRPIQADAIKDENQASLGEHIFYDGTGGGGMPTACAACHSTAGKRMPPMMGMMGRGRMGRGMKGSGNTANAPNLDGQHASYLISQLNRFAAGERPSPVMENIARSLSEADKNAVAEYLSGVK